MLRSYLKISLRNLRSQRVYTFLNITGLTIGLAGGLLIFLFIRYHLSTDRHHINYNRIFRVDTDLYLADGSIEYNPEAPLPMAQVMRTDYPQVDHAAFLMMIREMTLSIKRAGRTEPLRFREHSHMGFVGPEWFDILSYRWLQGNPKTALRQLNQVVLTQTYAQKYFGETNPLGQTITLDNRTNVTVVGVLADPPTTTDTNLGIFISLATLKQYDPSYDQTDWGLLNSTNRLYITLRDPDATASLERTFPALAKRQYGLDAKYYRFHLQPMREFHFDVARGGGSIRASLVWSLGIIGSLLILAACINFINLATAQALRRGKEVGVRKTLGSSRRQLVSQFLLETSLIVLIATSLALILVISTLPLINQWLSINLSLSINGQTFGFVVLLVGVVTGLAGGYPVAVLSGFSPWAALKGTLSLRSGGNYSIRQTLIVVQFMVCQVLIIGALVVANQIRYMQQADLGFRKDNVVLVTIPDKKTATQEAFRQQLVAYPDIQSVSFEHRPPASELNYGGSFRFNGKPDWDRYPVRERLADANYLRTYGLQLIAGRNIVPSDTIREYLINETLLRQLGFRDPQHVLGKTMQYYLSPVPLPIVGVISDFHQKSFRDPIGPCFIASYAPMYAQASIRITGQNQQQTVQRIRDVWQTLYPNEVFEYEFLNDQVARQYETENLVFRLVNIFSGIAMLICGLGLYGLVSFVVVQRTKEIGVRKVLGASVAGIVTLLSKDFLKLVLLAILMASPLAWWAMNNWLQDFAYKITIDGWIFVLAGLLAIGIALITVSFQSIKAALVNPINSLRSE
ncbi:ABC transporter permease [Spirosoma jeollabukense]